MAVAGPTIINENLKKLVNEESKTQYNILNNQWAKDINESNKLIEKIQSKSEYINEHFNEILEKVSDLNTRLDYYNELGIDLDDDVSHLVYNFSEMRRILESNYRFLTNQIYKYNNNQFDNNENKLKEMKDKMDKVNQKINEVDKRIENLGGTFLNIVLTISITTAMVSAIDKKTESYAFAIITGCAWLLLTSILFITEYYRAPDNKNHRTFGIVIYVILSIVTVIAIAYGCYDNKNNHKEEVVTNTTVIEYKIKNKDEIDSFINYIQNNIESNNTTNIVLNSLIENNNISEIIIYKDENNEYEFKIELIDSTQITMNLDDNKMAEWLLSIDEKE